MNSLKIKAVALVILFWTILYCSKFIFFFIPPNLPQKLIVGCLGSVIAFVLTYAFLKFENKNLSDICFSFSFGSLFRFGMGGLIGMGIMGGIIVLLLMLTPLKLEAVLSPNLLSVLGFSAIVMLAMALMEEIIFRGLPLIKLQEEFGIRSSIYVTSIVFGLYHGIAFESLLGPAVWGLVFGLMAAWSKGIALPTGLHFGLNWVQGFVGMKNQYVEPFWNFAVIESESIISNENLGLIIQVGLLILAVLSIEYYIKRERIRNTN